jgi:hypothetical protein
MIIPERHEIIWSQTLFACMQEMAERQTNPTLLILGGAESITTDQRYPDESLYFGNEQWRVFYHCHDSPDKDPAEHGHFHLFARQGEDWAHVVAMSIDHMGQPLNWFCVNRWVTGGPWLSRDDLLQHLNSDHYSIDDPLVGRWLFAMLQVYRSLLLDLLQQRDRQFRSLAGERDPQTVMEDRDIYTLASAPVDIQTTLEVCLSAMNESRHSIPFSEAANQYKNGNE